MKCLRAAQSFGLASILAISLSNLTVSRGVDAANTVAVVPTARVLIEAHSTVATTNLKAKGAVLLEDYGAFQLWQMPRDLVHAARVTADSAATSALDTIWLRGGNYIDTSDNTAANAMRSLPLQEFNSNPAQSQLWLLQFIGPIKSAWLSAIQQTGATPVAYMPSNAYIVWASRAALDQINALVAQGGFIHWAGPYQPSYRLAPELQRLVTSGDSGADQVRAAASNPHPIVTVQIFTTDHTAQTLAQLGAWAERVQGAAWTLDQYTFITLQLSVEHLIDIAQLSDVLNVEPWHAPRMQDERQDQIMAGNLLGDQPSGPGYLAWLQGKGVPSDPNAYPIVAVVDDGIDNGSTAPLHPDFYQLGDPAHPSRVAFVLNCTAAAATGAAPDSVAGHGNLNAGILAGYNAGAQPFERDAAGFSYGLGIAPFARIANVKAFNDQSIFDITQCDNTYASLVRRAYAAGARITTNSWGSDAAAAYGIDAFIYDALTRDADTRTPNSEQMLHIFSAGNRGGSSGKPYSVGAPGVAKNVLTVAASENVREDGVLDGCNDADANSANDVAVYSSRGPTNDGRAKPDLIAPGTHIAGPASKSPNFDASGICGAGLGSPDRRYYPAGQITYTWSSGTSHSTPAVAGAAVLAYEFYSRTLAPAQGLVGQAPSPAMLRALLLNSTRYLTGTGAADSLPGIGQGWGAIDLSLLYTDTTRRTLDQSYLFSESGQVYTATGDVVDSTRPFRVSLAWTDALGAIAGNAYVNDLDLAVEVNGVVYRGNNFSGQYAVPQGQLDPRNNIEQVFLPAGLSGSYILTVTARNIAGNGVPTDLEPNRAGDATDQDFALVLLNGSALTQQSLQAARELGLNSYAFAELSPTNNNAAIDPGERVQLTLSLLNRSVDEARDVVARIAIADSSDSATFVNDTVALGNIAANGVVTSAVPFVMDIAATQPCASFQLALEVSYVIGANAEPRSVRRLLQVPMGRQTLIATQAFTQTQADPLAIPDVNDAGVRAVLPMSELGVIDDIDVRLDQLQHGRVRDLVLRLIAPSGKSAVLLNRRGQDGAAGVGANLENLILDEQSPLSLDGLTGTGPYSGTFRPDQTFAVFKNEPVAGNWTLLIQDVNAGITGTLSSWGLNLSRRVAQCTLVLATPTPTSTPTPTATTTATATPPSIETPTTTIVPATAETAVPSVTATASPTIEPIPATATPTPSSVPTHDGAFTSTPKPTDTPQPTATPQATNTPKPTNTPALPVTISASDRCIPVQSASGPNNPDGQLGTVCYMNE